MRLLSFIRNEAAKDYEIRIVDWRGDRTYVGDCTVWHDKETGRRCSTAEEYELSAIWSRETRRIKIEKGV